MATIRDIARMTGYSITTVSRVINGHPYVEEQKASNHFSHDERTEL